MLDHLLPRRTHRGSRNRLARNQPPNVGPRRGPLASRRIAGFTALGVCVYPANEFTVRPNMMQVQSFGLRPLFFLANYCSWKMRESSNATDSLAEKWTLYIVGTPKIMPYFHATAVFEVEGTSLEDADRKAGTLFQSLHHNRIHYYEHDMTAGADSSPASRALYFSVIAEFDVEAGTEDRAGELADETFENLATDEVQFIAFGLTQGEQRVQPAERVEREKPEPAPLREASEEGGEGEERKGRKRAPRGRGRKRKSEREAESVSEESLQVGATAAEPSAGATEESERVMLVREDRVAREPVEPVVSTADSPEPKTELVTEPLEMVVEEPLPPPPRSSSAMRVTLTMSFRAKELGLQPNGDGALDREEFLSRAIAEARIRHPELPAEVSPTHEVVVQPWGETILTLTWAYDVPIPSASEIA